MLFESLRWYFQMRLGMMWLQSLNYLKLCDEKE